MIKTITDSPQCTMLGTWDEFKEWVAEQKTVQLDIETNVTSFWSTKVCKTIQFGDVLGEDQYVLDFNYLTPPQLDYIKSILEDWNVQKLIHNATFEYVVLKFYDIEVHNVFCTMVTEKLLNGGIEVANYSLADLIWKYKKVNIDKTLQTSFGEGYLTDEKVRYAATDVMYMGDIAHVQIQEIKRWGLENVHWLEMRCLLAFADCTFYGVKLNKDKWLQAAATAQPIVEKAEKELNVCLVEEVKLLSKAIEFGYYKTADTVNFNINAPKQKSELLQMVFPDIPGATQAVIKKYIRDNSTVLPSEKLSILVDLQEKSTTELVNYLMAYHRDELVEKGLVLPAGTITINWNSQQQALNVLKGIEPKLKGLDEESLSKTTHEVFIRLSEYKNSLKLLTSFGEEFITKFVEPDGMVRTNYNQVVSTGRSSSLRPNMQQIPAYESVGTTYRNAFEYHEGWVFVDSDYTGQELCLIAHASQDDVWFKAIENGHDLHSVTAAMVFGKKWEAATEETCAFKAKKDKCKCKGHKTLRTAIKTINFG